MSVRPFDDAAREATATAQPIPRGIAFHAPLPAQARRDLTATGPLAGWQLHPVAGLAGWFEATPPAAPPLTLGEFWERLRTLRAVDGVTRVEPLLLIATPQPATPAEAETFALGLGQDQFGLWGWPYDRETQQRIEQLRQAADWHLTQMRVRPAWDRWRAEHPGQAPGAGILVGHPDTGYSDHPSVKDRFLTPGRSFLRDEHGEDIDDARDDLRVVGPGVLQTPGHGTATASVIASDGALAIQGVAPGARVLPLRVSRSVVHFDFGNVGRAILHAVASGADVISMSLGGPTYSGFVRECIRQAHEQGVIVVSAAGNNLPVTVFPAAFPEVVAVAATNAAATPWRFSGIGRLVDIAAPGEDVWHARAALTAADAPDFSVTPGTGTSFATAGVAGLAALWLSYHGGRAAVAARAYSGRVALVPFAFTLLLARTANSGFEFVREGIYGAGIPDAEQLLLAPLPSQAEVERFEQVVRAQPVHLFTFFTGLLSGGRAVTEPAALTLSLAATTDAAGKVREDAVTATDAVARAVEARAAEEHALRRLLGPRAGELADELLARAGADRLLLIGFQRWRQGESLLPLLDRLLAVSGAAAPDAPPPGLSAALFEWARAQRQQEQERLRQLHRGRLAPGVAPSPAGAVRPGPPPPDFRHLRAYAFDPSLETKLDTAPISQVMIPTRWEEVAPGPIGEYLEVIDVDPASGCVYAPVDLDHPHVLVQDGLPPSEGNPQFHQQMVYAVAMNAVHRFELALGRPIFWSPLRPWLPDRPEERRLVTPEALAMMGYAQPDGPPPPRANRRDRYVQRLRLYPHALREANAYYSPTKRAVLFGYFPGADDDTGRHFPGGMVFTCLSHDIIVHETTHALLDGMHSYFNEPSNEDVWAFHEAFADIMALFQHFTYPEVLRHQLANTRGDLQTDSLLGQLAQQFGEATGRRGALRNALGGVDPATGRWERRRPDPRALRGLHEPHQRGSILVAAVFDAFLALYNDRVADLLRIYTGGTGVLPAGRIHPDLVNRLAVEAAQAAEMVLRICIRALDYVPPVDITFGEFLRALITADYDLSPAGGRRNRIAFIDAFRLWGIYPRDVLTLSEESLRWHGPAADGPFTRLTQTSGAGRARHDPFTDYHQRTLARLMRVLEVWQPGKDRKAIFSQVLRAQAVFHDLLVRLQRATPAGRPLLPGLDLRDGAGFSIGNLRPARRVGPQGEFRTEMVVEVVQTHRPPAGSPPDAVPFRGGATLVVDLRDWSVRYVVYKRLYEHLPPQPGGEGVLTNRRRRQQRFVERQWLGAAGTPEAFWLGEDTGNLAEWLAATYACRKRLAARRGQRPWGEPFALLHRTVE
jgi:hypothetical protein